MSNLRVLGVEEQIVGAAPTIRLRVIAIEDGLAVHADKDTAAHEMMVRGIGYTNGVPGVKLVVIVFGAFEDDSFAFTPGLPIYVGDDGALTQVAPVTGFVKQVAVADTATRIFINVQPSEIEEVDLSGYLPLTGGTLTGALTIPDDTIIGNGNVGFTVKSYANQVTISGGAGSYFAINPTTLAVEISGGIGSTGMNLSNRVLDIISNGVQGDLKIGTVRFGGTTNAFPALKRSGTELQVRLADDSDYSTLKLKTLLAETNANIGGGTIDVAYGATIRGPDDLGNTALKLKSNNQTQSLILGWGGLQSSSDFIFNSGGYLRFQPGATGYLGFTDSGGGSFLIYVASGSQNVEILGNLVVGASGSPIDKVLTATAVLDFPEIAAGASASAAIALTGITDSTWSIFANPEALEAGLVWSCIQTFHEVEIRLHNISAAPINPASRSWRVTAIKY